MRWLGGESVRVIAVLGAGFSETKRYTVSSPVLLFHHRSVRGQFRCAASHSDFVTY